MKKQLNPSSPAHEFEARCFELCEFVTQAIAWEHSGGSWPSVVIGSKPHRELLADLRTYRDTLDQLGVLEHMLNEIAKLEVPASPEADRVGELREKIS